MICLQSHLVVTFSHEGMTGQGMVTKQISFTRGSEISLINGMVDHINLAGEKPGG